MKKKRNVTNKAHFNSVFKYFKITFNAVTERVFNIKESFWSNLIFKVDILKVVLIMKINFYKNCLTI